MHIGWPICIGATFIVHRSSFMYRLPSIPRAALGPILLVSVLVLLLFWRTPPPRPRIAPPSAVVNVMSPPERFIIAGAPTPSPQPLVGAFIHRNDLDVISADGLFSAEEQASLGAEVEQALNYVTARFGSAPTGRVSAYIGWEASCGLHGIAYTEQRVAQVFTCPDLPRSRAVNIMAHEFVHQLAQDYYGPRHLQADMILLEGLATWGAGEYWLGDQADFAAIVRQYKESGQLLPLATSYVGRPIGDMNQLYYQWASFVDFLISRYGRDKFDALYVSGSSAPGSADYGGVYGKDLAALEQEWLSFLER